MKTFDIRNAVCLQGKQGRTKRRNVRSILDNLLRKAGYDPEQFEVIVTPDDRLLAKIVGDGCEFRSKDSKDLMVSVVVGKEHFFVKLRSKTCQPQTLNQDIRRALGASGKAGFQFTGDQVYEKVKPKASDIKLQPKQSTSTIAQTPVIMKTIKSFKALPDLVQPFLGSANVLAAHMAIYKEIGDDKHYPFSREEAQAWIVDNGIVIKHHVATGLLMGSLVRRGLYIKITDEEKKGWKMTPLGDDVALKQKKLPADEQPKKPRKKKGGLSVPLKPEPEDSDKGKVAGVSEASQTGELQNLLITIAGDQADLVRDLVEANNRLKAIDAERSTLLAKRETLIAKLNEIILQVCS